MTGAASEGAYRRTDWFFLREAYAFSKTSAASRSSTKPLSSSRQRLRISSRHSGDSSAPGAASRLSISRSATNAQHPIPIRVTQHSSAVASRRSDYVFSRKNSATLLLSILPSATARTNLSKSSFEACNSKPFNRRNTYADTAPALLLPSMNGWFFTM